MEVRNRDEAEPFTAIDGSTIREIMHPNSSKVRNQSLAEAIVRQGEETNEHHHLRSEEIYYILQGSGIMRIACEERAVREKDAILIPPGKRHNIRNTGSRDLIFLCCSAPSYSDNDAFLE